MHHIQLPEQVFEKVQLRAVEAGFDSVDDYVIEVLTGELQVEIPDIGQFFTPARLARISDADAQIDAGQSFTSEQVEVELAKRKRQWLRQQNAGQ